MTTQLCPLCKSKNTGLFYQDRLRQYNHCNQCKLVFVPPQFHLSADDEKKRYDFHQNSPDRADYKRFLNILLERLTIKLRPASKGLDYGSGPVPVLSMLMADKSFTVDNFDLYYANNPDVLAHQYDFVTCVETVEHFRYPQSNWVTMINMLKKGGWLGIMTELLMDSVDFASWYYKSDTTHINFYSEATFIWLANKYKMNVSVYGSSVILLQRKE